MTNRIHEIINLKVLSDIDSQNENFYWNTGIYQSAIQQNKNLLSHVARRLELKLNSEHKKSISYTVESKLEGKEKELGICINLHYSNGSDLDINLLIKESESLASRIIKTIKSISETTNIDINDLKIEEHNQHLTTVKNDRIYVEKGLKNMIHDILDDLKNNNEITCKIGTEIIEMTLPKTNIELFEGDDNEIMIGRISGVMESDIVAHVVSENKKEVKYSYSKELETELTGYQHDKTILKLSLKKTYRNFRGEKKHVSGTITSIEKYTSNNQLGFF